MAKVLPPNVMQNQSMYEEQRFIVRVTPDIELDDVLNPRFWAHHVSRLNIDAMIRVVSMDHKFDIDLSVTEKGVGFINMRVLRKWVNNELPKELARPNVTMEDLPDGYKVAFAPKKLWRVFLTEPLIQIAEGLASREHAIQRAIEHASSIKVVAA